MAYAIRRVDGREWKQVRELRLSALADTPIGFGMWHEDALGLPDEYWQEKTRRDATDPKAALFIAVNEETGEWVGSAGGYLADENSHYWLPDRDQMVVYAVYVDPAHRGRECGVSSLLFEGVIAWGGRELPTAGVTLGVHERNDRAHAFYRRFGFVDTDRSVPYNLDTSATVLIMDYRPDGQ
jgi:ribosomal protein S18 acetylase RimI-like enzyme